MFAAEFEPAQEVGRRVRGARLPVAVQAGVSGRGGLARALCKVVDVSLHGARLQTYSALTRGTSIWLTLPAVGQVVADVMWADDYAAGCLFRQPLAPEQLDALVAVH